MTGLKLLDFIRIDEFSATPKYLQLANCVINAVKAKAIQKDYFLPSINELSFRFDVSRDTIHKSYRHLKKIGILRSFPGKGYCITELSLNQTVKIFLLFNKLSVHKKILYDAIVKGLGDEVPIDFYIYNNDFNLFKKLLKFQQQEYTHFVIIPPSVDDGEKASEIINQIPKDKLVMLDKDIAGIDGEYSVVYENFAADIYNALNQARPQLKKYHTIKLIFPDQSYYPLEIKKGFENFCFEYAFKCEVVNDIRLPAISKGEVFINLMEDDLVTLVERIKENNFKIGKDVGIISYNETPLKKIILSGVSTISTDFNFMGTMVANVILNDTKQRIEVPFKYTRRPSL